MRQTPTSKRILLVILVIVAAWALVENVRRVHLNKQLAALRNQADLVDSLKNENKRLRAALATSGLSREQDSENQDAKLLRLRGEVSVLRRQVFQMSTNNAGPSALAPVTVDVSSPLNSLSNLFMAIHLADMRAVRQFLTPKSDLLRRLDLDDFAAMLEKVQFVSVYATTNVAFAVSDPLPHKNRQSALLFEIRNVEGNWLLHKWGEPWFYRLALRGDLRRRLEILQWAWAAGTGLACVLFGINVHQPPLLATPFVGARRAGVERRSDRDMGQPATHVDWARLGAG